MWTVITLAGILAQTGADQERLAKEALASAVLAYEDGIRCFRGALFPEARKNYERALEVFVTHLGPAHPTSVEAAIQLSSTYLETGQISRAARVVERHLTVSDGLSARDRAALLAELGSVRMHQGRLTEAEGAYRKALEVFENGDDPQSIERSVIALSNLAGVYLKARRTADGLAAIERARSILASLPDAPPELTVKTLANAAFVYASTKSQPGKTNELYQAVIRFCERALGPSHFLLGPILVNYADFLRGERRKEEADAARKRGQAIQAGFAGGAAAKD